uniref:cytochrome P450 n=1 Tax=Amycolatopsis sp. CA-096443 TaxID=3239919 RepID=UPI003F4998C9
MNEDQETLRVRVPVETDFDHLDPGIAADLHEHLGALRAKCPVAHTSAHGGIHLALGYDAVAEAARNAAGALSADVNIGAAPKVAPAKGCTAPMFEVDGADHRAWRRVVARYFTQDAAAEHEISVRRLCRAAIAEFAADGRADLVTAYTRVIPPLVVAMVIGIPEHRRPALAEHVRRFLSASSSAEEERSGAEYEAFLAAVIESELSAGRESMLAAAARTPTGGEVPSLAQLARFAALMLAAGHLTTSDACAGVLLHLLGDDGRRARVAADPEFLARVIDESIRHEPPVAVTGRAVVEDVELAGVPLVAGDRVGLVWGSANRDDAVFPDGAEFRPERAEPDAQQLAWGTGPHQCLGKHIARMEVRIMIEELLWAIPGFRLEPGARPARTYGVIRGVSGLPVTWPVP